MNCQSDATTTCVQDTSPQFQHQGSWGTQNSGQGGTWTASYNTGDTGSFTFTGTSIQVIGMQFQAQAGPRGSTTFTLDGRSTTVGNPPALNPNQDITLFSQDGLSNGQHTLHVTNNGVDLLIDFFKVGNAGTSSGQQSQNPPAASSATTTPKAPATTVVDNPPPSTSQQQTQSTSSPQSGNSDPSNNSSGNSSSSASANNSSTTGASSTSGAPSGTGSSTGSNPSTATSSDTSSATKTSGNLDSSPSGSGSFTTSYSRGTAIPASVNASSGGFASNATGGASVPTGGAGATGGASKGTPIGAIVGAIIGVLLLILLIILFVFWRRRRRRAKTRKLFRFEQRAFGPESPPAPVSPSTVDIPVIPPPLDEKDEKDPRASWAPSAVSTLPEYGYTSHDPPPFVFGMSSDGGHDGGRLGDGDGDGERSGDTYTLRSVSPTSLSRWPMPPGDGGLGVRDQRWPISLTPSERPSVVISPASPKPRAWPISMASSGMGPLSPVTEGKHGFAV